MGVLHCTTARCNGRLFGYLRSIIAPSLKDETKTEGPGVTSGAGNGSNVGVQNLKPRLPRTFWDRAKCPIFTASPIVSAGGDPGVYDASQLNSLNAATLQQIVSHHVM